MRRLPIVAALLAFAAPVAAQQTGSQTNPYYVLTPDGLGLTTTQGAYTPLTPMQSGLGIASSTGLTIPTGATYAVVCAYSQAVNYTTDGTTTPTTTATGVGMQLAAGSCLPLVGATVISNFRAIQQNATATLSVSYFKQ